MTDGASAIRTGAATASASNVDFHLVSVFEKKPYSTLQV